MPFTRRQFLACLAAAAPACRRRDGEAPVADPFVWSGIGFGIEMSIEMFGVTESKGEELGAFCEKTIAALEQAFSLYQENSELRILNRERVLASPGPLFRELLALATRLQQRTLGYYQPAVHGAWSWLEDHGFPADPGDDPSWRDHCAVMDLRFVESAAGGAIRLTHPLTQLSMNAIGQGFLADKVAAGLRAAGVTSAMLHLGESYAIGAHPEGRPWNLAVMGTNDLVGTIEFADAGLAVSASDAGRLLIDPVARSVRSHARVAAVVSREGAAVADAFATAFAVAPADAWPRLADALGGTPGAQVRIWEENRLSFQRP